MDSISPSGSTNSPRIPELVLDDSKQTTTKSRKSQSGSSELTDLTSDGSSSSKSTSSSTEGDKQKSPSDNRDDVDRESSYASEEELFNDTYTGKAPSREERVKYRDLLNTRLEQMFGTLNPCKPITMSSFPSS